MRIVNAAVTRLEKLIFCSFRRNLIRFFAFLIKFMSAGNIPIGFRSRHRRKRSKSDVEKPPLETPTPKDHSLAQAQAIVAPSVVAKSGKFELSNSKALNSVEDSSKSNAATDAVSGSQQKQRRQQQTVAAAAAAADGKRKRRRRRAPRRRWKPYYKLTSDERRQLEIREERRAERVRALRFKHGLPVAPYNTTQFLLNDRQQRGNADEPNNVDEIVANIGGSSVNNKRREQQQLCRSESYEESVSESGRENSVGSAGGAAAALPDVDDDYDDMMEREFDNEYESACAERLESMTKNDLIKEYLELEKQLEKSQRELNARIAEVTELRQRLSVFEDKQRATTIFFKEDIDGSDVVQNLKDSDVASTAT